MSKNKLEGIIAYPITPYDENDHINLTAFEDIVANLIKSQADAICVLGSAGENSYLELEEWKSVLQSAKNCIPNHIPLVVGLCELKTKNAINKAKLAQAAGADILMVIPASYWKLTDDEIFDYYKAIADEIELPIMLYNNPTTSGVDISPELIFKIYNEINNIQYLKESTGDLKRICKIINLTKHKLPIFLGSNPHALDALAIGVSGWCTAAPNLIGTLPKELYQAIQNQDLCLARKLFHMQFPLLEFITSNGLVRTVKYGYKLLGKDYGKPRLPLKELDVNKQEVLKEILQILGEMQSCTK